MKKYSQLFSSLLVVLLMLNLATPAIALASTEGIDTSDIVEGDVANEVEQPVADSLEIVEEQIVEPAPAVETNEEQVEVSQPVEETATHPAAQTEVEKLQEANEVTHEAMKVAEENVASQARSGGKEVSINIENPFIKGDKTVFDNGDEIGISMDWNITSGTTVQSGDYFKVKYPYFLEAVKSSFPMNHGTCEASNGEVTCTFDERVNGLDDIQGGLEFGGKLIVEKGTGEQTVSLTVNGELVKDIVLDGGSNEVGGVINQLVDKMGTRADDNHLNWIITLNGDQSANTIKLMDRPNQGHKIIPGSIVVSVNGTSFSYNELSGSGVVRSHSITPEQIYLELQLGGQLAAVSYQTEIVSENVKEWSNTVSVSATTHYGQVQESESAKVEKYGGAWSQGELAKHRGSFTVVKIDEAGTPLQGATFDLKDNEGNVVQTFTTDENGQATIADITGGHYTLVETKAPVGYVLNEEAMDVMLKFDQEKSFTKEVVNKKEQTTEPSEPKEPTVPENVCENFTVNTENGSKVTITDKETKEVISEGTVTDGTFVTKNPLEPGKDYTVAVEKEGYETATKDVTGSEDNCEVTVELTKVPAKNVCENFIVTVKDGEKLVNDAKVTIKQGDKIVASGTTGGKAAAGNNMSDGQYIKATPLEPGKDYTVIVEKDGYETVTKPVQVDENCKVEINLTPEKNVCENFTVNTENGSKVTITDEAGNVVEEGTVEEGTFVTKQPLQPGKDYTVTVEKDGYEKETVEVKGSEENCEITVDLTEVPVKDVCENFTVNTENGSTVTITDEAGNVVEEGTVEEGTFVTKQPLQPGKDYTVTVEKDGYEKATVEVKGSEENCEITVDLTEVPAKNVCEDFTVNVKKDGEIVEDATVQIVDENGNVVSEGTTDANGQFVTEEPLTPGNWYEVIINGDHIQGVKGSEDNCETTIDLVEKPTTPTEPTEPVEPTEPTEPVEPEDGEEKPSIEEKPTTPTEPTKPVEPTEPEKPTTGGGGGNTPTDPTPVEPEDGEEKPSIEEKPTTPTEPTKPVEPTEPEKPTTGGGGGGNTPTDPTPVEPEDGTELPSIEEKPVEPEDGTELPSIEEKPVTPEDGTELPSIEEKPVTPEDGTELPSVEEKPVTPEEELVAGVTENNDKAETTKNDGEVLGEKETNQKPMLPQTGQSIDYMLIVFAMMFIAAGAYLTRRTA